MYELAFLFSQIFAGIALLFDIFSFQFKKRKKILLCFVVSGFCLMTHYFLLNKITTGFIFLVVTIRYITSYFSSNKKFIYLFIFINTCILFYFYKEFYDLISYIGITITTIAIFQIDNKKLRKITMCGTSFILLYDILIFTPMGILAEIVFLSSNIIGYYRYYIKK